MNRPAPFVPLIVLLGTALPGAAQDPGARDDDVLAARYLRVERELLAVDCSALTPGQRAARTQAIAWLREYRERADFGVNRAFPGERMPYFVDDDGRRCAVAFLLDRSGRGALTEAIAAADNHAWLADVAQNRELQRWLTEHGLSLVEAARIQGPAFQFPVRVPPELVPPPDQPGPQDATSLDAPASGPARPAAPRAAVTRGTMGAPATTATNGPRGAAATAKLDWLDWWEGSRLAYLHEDGDDGTSAAAALRQQHARDAARAAILPDLRAVHAASNAHLRAAATLSLGRAGSEAELPLLQERLQDPQQSIRYWALLAIGAAGGPRASFVLGNIAADRRGEHLVVGPSARAIAVLGLALSRGGVHDAGLVAGIAQLANTRAEHEVRLASMLYADLADPATFVQVAGAFQAERDLVLRSRALEGLATVATDEAVATLTRALSGKQRELRRSAALALGRSPHPLALPALQTAHDLEREHLTRGVIALALGQRREPAARAFLREELARGPKALRGWAALGLGLSLRAAPDADACAELRAAFARERNDSFAPAYLLALGLARDEASVPLLAGLLAGDGEAAVRAVAADALALAGGRKALDVLRDHLRADPCRSTRIRLAELLCSAGEESDRDEVLDRLRLAEDDQERAGIAFALGARFAPRAFAGLRAILRDPRADPRLRASAAHALGRMLDARTPHRLAELSRGSNWRLQPDWLDGLVASTL